MECFTKTYLVLDALDEITEQDRDELLHILGKLSAFPKANMIVTSRKEDYLITTFQSLPFHQISLSTSEVDEDIRRYISEIINKDSGFSKWTESLRSEVENTLSKRAGGMLVIFIPQLCFIEFL